MAAPSTRGAVALAIVVAAAGLGACGDASTTGSADGGADAGTGAEDAPADARGDAWGPLPPPLDGGACGYQATGRLLQVAPGIEVCLPAVVCTAETCPPPLGTCTDGRCRFAAGYAGLATLPEAWATYYCDLAGEGCHGVTQIDFAEVTAAAVSTSLGLPECYRHDGAAAKCVGIMAAPPLMVGNSQEAIDPATGTVVGLWGLGMTEATGSCYEVTGPGGTAVLAVTDRCGGYCRCRGSGFQECGPCVSAPDMEPHCACVGPVPGLYAECCGRGCSTLEADCDWCASNNHPHFDLDTDAFNWVCGAAAVNGSCRLTEVRYVPCAAPKDWPPGGGSATCPPQSFSCPGGSPAPEQPRIPGTECCCYWGLQPQADGTCA